MLTLEGLIFMQFPSFPITKIAVTECTIACALAYCSKLVCGGIYVFAFLISIVLHKCVRFQTLPSYMHRCAVWCSQWFE